MNKTEHKRRLAIADQLEKAAADFEDAIQEIATLAQERYDEMSEKAQAGERGQLTANTAEALQTAADYAQEAFDRLDEAVVALRGIEE